MSAALWLFNMQHKTPPAATLSCRTGLLREARPLRKRRGIMTQRHTHSSPFSFRAISQTAMSRKVSPMGRG